MKKGEFTQKEFKAVIQKARKEYFSWEKQFFCPYFEENIFITRSGWEHLMTEKRPKHQKYWRAKYFHFIPKIIQKTTTVQRSTVYYLPSGKTQLWSFIAIEDGNILEVVIRQIENQPKHFYSFIYKGLAPKIIGHK